MMCMTKHTTGELEKREIRKMNYARAVKCRRICEKKPNYVSVDSENRGDEGRGLSEEMRGCARLLRGTMGAAPGAVVGSGSGEAGIPSRGRHLRRCFRDPWDLFCSDLDCARTLKAIMTAFTSETCSVVSFSGALWLRDLQWISWC